MALFGSNGKEQLVVDLVTAQKEISMLREMLSAKDEDAKILREQLKWTQEALIAKESPEAYIDQRAAAEDAIPLSAEETERRNKAQTQVRNDKKILEEIEGPLFRDAEEMQQILSRPLIAETVASKPLHAGGES